MDNLSFEAKVSLSQNQTCPVWWVGGWLDKLRILPSQPPTEVTAGAELGKNSNTSQFYIIQTGLIPQILKTQSLFLNCVV